MKVIKKLNKLIDVSCIHGIGGKVLYDSENITDDYSTSKFIGQLNDSIDNYKRLKIYAYVGGYNIFTEVYTSMKGTTNKLQCCLTGTTTTSKNYMYLYNIRVLLESTSFTVERKYAVEFITASNQFSVTEETAKVYKIIGFKY